MLGRKKNNKPEPTPDQQLEQRVDAMMDPSHPDAPSAPVETPPETTQHADTALPPLDIFSDPKTAPDVPKNLLKQLGADAAVGETSTPATETNKPETTKAAMATTQFDDAKTDAAVNDIVAHESDTVLAAEDAATRPSPVKSPVGRTARKSLVRRWWFWLLAVIVILGSLAAVPYTRFAIAGLLIKQDFTIQVTDSSTHTRVSDAVVSLGGQQTKTDASGKVTLHVPVGKHILSITKQYYQSYSQSVTVPITKTDAAYQVSLRATGRQVPVTVKNTITGQPLAGVSVKVLNTTAQTDKTGKAIIVLPAGSDSDSVSLSLAGYNTLSGRIQVTDQVVAANSFKLTPSGHVYFLSNATGKIDVVKTDLDGSNRQTVLAGTGTEDNSTVLLASSDWKYLALLSKRAGGQYPVLYLISTADDSLTTIDQGNINFTPIGWSGHYFMYRADDPSLSTWQSGATNLKSYNADTGKSVTLAATNATGSSNADAQYESIIDTLIMNNKLVYDKTWYDYPGILAVSGKQNSLDWVNPDGSGAKTLKTVDSGTSYFSNLKLVKPDELDFGVYNNSSASTTYYRLDDSGNATQSNTITDATIMQPSPAYLVSPSGDQVFWGEIRDGKDTLFTGDQNAANQTTVAVASDYAPYGWYGDSYLLVSKNGSELYIMSADGKGKAIKISDYYKPAQNFYGYGGGQ